jgi:pyruvate dehydrogenase E1 component
MNENYVHPAMPQGAEDGILRGMYLLRSQQMEKKPATGHVQLLASGTILREALAAAELLENDWNIAVDVWSVTSFTELRRNGLEVERWNRLHPVEPRRVSWVEQCLGPTAGPVIAANDYVRAVPDLIRTWVPRRYVTLGADGFGRSDTRAGLRGFFAVDHYNIALAAIGALADERTLSREIAAEFMKRYGGTHDAAASWDDRRDAAQQA